MRKSYLYPLLILGSGVVFVIIYLLANFSLLPIGKEKIAEIEVPNKPYSLELYYVEGNATVNENIHVFKSGDSVLQAYEGYNFIKEYKIAADTLILVLADTSDIKLKADTFYLKLP